MTCLSRASTTTCSGLARASTTSTGLACSSTASTGPPVGVATASTGLSAGPCLTGGRTAQQPQRKRKRRQRFGVVCRIATTLLVLETSGYGSACTPRALQVTCTLSQPASRGLARHSKSTVQRCQRTPADRHVHGHLLGGCASSGSGAVVAKSKKHPQHMRRVPSSPKSG